MIRYKRLNESYPVKNGDKLIGKFHRCVDRWEEDALRNLDHDLSKYTTAFAEDIIRVLEVEDEDFTFVDVSLTGTFTIGASFSRNNKQPVDEQYCEKILSAIKKELNRPDYEIEWRSRSFLQEGGVRLGLFIGKIDVVEGNRENEFVVEIKLKPIWDYVF